MQRVRAICEQNNDLNCTCFFELDELFRVEHAILVYSEVLFHRKPFLCAWFQYSVAHHPITDQHMRELVGYHVVRNEHLECGCFETFIANTPSFEGPHCAGLWLYLLRARYDTSSGDPVRVLTMLPYVRLMLEHHGRPTLLPELLFWIPVFRKYCALPSKWTFLDALVFGDLPRARACIAANPACMLTSLHDAIDAPCIIIPWTFAEKLANGGVAFNDDALILSEFVLNGYACTYLDPSLMPYDAKPYFTAFVLLHVCVGCSDLFLSTEASFMYHAVRLYTRGIGSANTHYANESARWWTDLVLDWETLQFMLDERFTREECACHCAPLLWMRLLTPRQRMCLVDYVRDHNI